jgi:hypothetical protein
MRRPWPTGGAVAPKEKKRKVPVKFSEQGGMALGGFEPLVAEISYCLHSTKFLLRT